MTLLGGSLVDLAAVPFLLEPDRPWGAAAYEFDTRGRVNYLRLGDGWKHRDLHAERTRRLAVLDARDIVRRGLGQPPSALDDLLRWCAVTLDYPKLDRHRFQIRMEAEWAFRVMSPASFVTLTCT